MQPSPLCCAEAARKVARCKGELKLLSTKQRSPWMPGLSQKGCLTGRLLLLLLLLLYLTGDELDFVVELLAVVNNSPARVNVNLSCLARDRHHLDRQRGRYDQLRWDLGLQMSLGRGQVVGVSALRQLGVIVVVETLDEVHRLRICVEDDARLRARVSHHVPSAVYRTQQ